MLQVVVPCWRVTGLHHSSKPGSCPAQRVSIGVQAFGIVDLTIISSAPQSERLKKKPLQGLQGMYIALLHAATEMPASLPVWGSRLQAIFEGEAIFILVVGAPSAPCARSPHGLAGNCAAETPE